MELLLHTLVDPPSRPLAQQLLPGVGTAGLEGALFLFSFCLSCSSNPLSWLKNISRQVCALRTGDSTPPDCLEGRDWFHCCFQQGHYQTGFIWMVSFQLDCVAWLGCSVSFVLQLSDWKRWEEKGKSILKHFFTARKITQNVDLCPQSATRSGSAILNLLTSQNVWDLSSQLKRLLQDYLTLDNPGAPDIVLKAPQEHGEGAALPQDVC